MIDESKLSKADKLLLKLHRNMLARAKARGAIWDELNDQREFIEIEIWDYVATLPTIGDKHP